MAADRFERQRSVSGETRRAIMTQLLKRGPASAADLGDLLAISAAGVRRHLDSLLAEGLAETCDPHSVAGEETARGRPAKHFRLTEAGRDQFGTSYDTLAVQAVDAIERLGGQRAVRVFAQERIQRILGDVRSADTDGEVMDAVTDVAAAFETHGYAASVTRIGNGIQICQHHCPVSAVAASHPEICEAEHEAISAIVGCPVQPLALITDGNGVCTTNIPLASRPRDTQTPSSERSGGQ